MSLPSYTTVKELKVKKRRYRISLKKSPGTYLKLQLKAGGGGWGAFIAGRMLNRVRDKNVEVYPEKTEHKREGGGGGGQALT